MSTDDEELTNLQADERLALTGYREATLRVVSALRRYRAASKQLLVSRYADGECDAVALGRFESECVEIEEGS